MSDKRGLVPVCGNFSDGGVLKSAPDIEKMLTEFHAAMDLSIGTGASVEVPEKELRFALVQEEYEELRAEWGSYWGHREDDGYKPADTAKWAKEAADLVYVILGSFVTFGIPFYPVFEEVHRSNMSKLGSDGKPIKRNDGKVTKGPNYSPADIEGVLGL